MRLGTSKRYTVVGMDESPGTEQYGYGSMPRLTNLHTIIGHRAYMESAQDLMHRTVDQRDSVYVYAFVRENEDGMVVLECEQGDEKPRLDITPNQRLIEAAMNAADGGA